jgi:uncharacterized protein
MSHRHPEGRDPPLAEALLKPADAGGVDRKGVPRGAACILGLDLAGPANRADTAIVRIEGGPAGFSLVAYASGLDDAAIAGWLEEAPNLDAIGLDAPLSYQDGGGDRPGDRLLRARLTALGLTPGSVMPPTLTRMAYLSLRGLAVARLCGLIRPGVPVAEVHPGGVLLLRGAPAGEVRGLKHDLAARLALCACLEANGLNGAGTLTASGDHVIAAAAAALGAADHLYGRARWLHPACPPLHPHDYVC